MTAVVARPLPTEAAVLHLPQGGTAVIHLRSGYREYRSATPGEPLILVVAGDGKLLGQGVHRERFASWAEALAPRHPLDGETWHRAVDAVRGGGVAYVEHEKAPADLRWAAVGVRGETHPDPDAAHKAGLEDAIGGAA